MPRFIIFSPMTHHLINVQSWIEVVILDFQIYHFHSTSIYWSPVMCQSLCWALGGVAMNTPIWSVHRPHGYLSLVVLFRIIFVDKKLHIEFSLRRTLRRCTWKEGGWQDWTEEKLTYNTVAADPIWSSGAQRTLHCCPKLRSFYPCMRQSLAMSGCLGRCVTLSKAVLCH